jgi:uncharacterized membrane protein YphA (DoxX/SURF4 family)
MIILVSILLVGAALYLIAGVLFAVLFLTKGIQKVDSTATGSTIGFRLIILPGTIIFWPVLLHKWRTAKK